MSADPRDRLIFAAAQTLIARRYKMDVIGEPASEDDPPLYLTFSGMLEQIAQHCIKSAKGYEITSEYREANHLNSMANSLFAVLAKMNNLAYAIPENEALLGDDEQADPMIACSLIDVRDIKVDLEKVAESLVSYAMKTKPAGAFETARTMKTIIDSMIRDFETTIGKNLPFQRDPAE